MCRVDVAALAMSETEVTLGEFKAFVAATQHATQPVCSGRSVYGVHGYFADRWYLHPWTPQDDTHPVVCVSHNDAVAYVQWVNTFVEGDPYRLPSEAEWEYVASNRVDTMATSWNGPVALVCQFGNVADQSYLAALRQVPENASEKAYRDGRVAALIDASAKCDDGFASTAPVGAFPKNSFGIYDMDGNVSEWVQDCVHPSYEAAPLEAVAWQSENGGDCTNRVHRGADWSYSSRSWLGHGIAFSNARIFPWDRNAKDAAYTHAGIGFRLARDMP